MEVIREAEKYPKINLARKFDLLDLMLREILINKNSSKKINSEYSTQATKRSRIQKR